MERTLIIIKPDGVQRNLIGEIISRFERRGLKIIGMKLMQVSRELAAKHYAIHEGKPFYNGLIDYITSGPVVVMALEAPNAVVAARTTIGATKAHEAAGGTIRGDFAIQVGRNLVHGSDSPENGAIEVANFFDESELINWTPTITPWVLE